MNSNPYFPNTHPYLAFFVHRSGVPLLIYLYCLVLVTDPGREIWALVLSVPVALFFERLVARRAMSQPFWTLGVAFLAAPAAAMVSSLTVWGAKGLDTVTTALGRTSMVIDFERRLELIWTIEGTCVLVLAFLLLWVVGSTFQDHIPISRAALTAAEKRARVFLVFSLFGFALSLAVATFALGDLRESMRNSGWEALPQGGNLSFSHPLLKDQKSYKVVDRYLPYRKEVNLSKEEHLELFGSVADDIWAKRFELTKGETHLVWRLAQSLSTVEPGDPRAAGFAVAALAHSRHWRLGCTEGLTFDFRVHTLRYLAPSASSQAELDDFRKWLPYLELHDEGGVERQDLALLMSRKLELWGREWDNSPAELYYALDHLLFPPHAPLAPGLNPESETLQAVLTIRRRQLTTGDVPRHFPLSPEVGDYELDSSGGARIVLGEIDPVCRPAAVVEFAPVNASTLEPESRKGGKARDTDRLQPGI